MPKAKTVVVTTLVVACSVCIKPAFVVAQSAAEVPAPEVVSSKAEPKKLNVATLVGPMESAPELFSKMRLMSSYDENATHESAQLSEQVPAAYSFCWAAPNFYHQPLYFEQAYLERFGAGRHRAIQPFSSGLAFYSRFPLLPVMLLKEPLYSREYTLGYRRPGDRVTHVPLFSP